ncbi:MAG: cache domain-containing protein [Devosia sp.]
MKNFLSIGLVALLLSSAPGLAGEVEVRALVARKAAIIKTLHDKATLAIVQVAQDPAFPTYFEAAHLGQHDHAHEAKARIDNISLATQAKFQVEEMCLIDINGAEVSRIVKNQIAYDLSLEEASAAFFAPSFARPPRSTYIAPLYMSPDVDRWVLAYTTPIELNGEKVAILHYEHGLDTYQDALSKEAPPANTFVIAVDSNGYVVSDTRRAIPIEKRGESDEPGDYFEPFAFGGMDLERLTAANAPSSVARVADKDGDYLVSYKTVADWTIVVGEKL